MEALNRDGAGPVWVGGAGRSGYSTHHHAQFVTHSDLIPRVDCVLLMVGINDLWRALSGWLPHTDIALLPKPIWYRSSIMR